MFPSLLSGTEPGLKACVIDDLTTALGEDAATVGALVKNGKPLGGETKLDRACGEDYRSNFEPSLNLL